VGAGVLARPSRARLYLYLVYVGNPTAGTRLFWAVLRFGYNADMISGRPLVLVLILLASCFSLLCGAMLKLLKSRKPAGVRNYLTLAGLVCATVAVGALFALHLTWTSADFSQRLGVGTIRILASLLFWPMLAGLILTASGVGRIRFFGLGTCLLTGLWWFTLAMGSAISMGAPIARHPTRFLVPKAYVGWVKIEYGRDAAPLEMANGKYICRIPPSGVLVTSSLLEEGWAKDEYFSYADDGSLDVLPDTGWGGGGMIWAGSVTGDPSGAKRFTQNFYVGKEDQYRRNDASQH
jgi:hypothetical protein